MKITEIRTHLLSVPFSDPPKTGFLTLPNIDLLVVEVETDAGVVEPAICIRWRAECGRWRCASMRC